MSPGNEPKMCPGTGTITRPKPVAKTDMNGPRQIPRAQAFDDPDQKATQNRPRASNDGPSRHLTPDLAPARDREFADSPVEQAGFELSVPP
jgi:hypothetical protein